MNFFEAQQGAGNSVVPTPNFEGRYPRGTSLEGVANFRTLGGLPIENSNRVIKQRTIYRSAAPTYASEKDKAFLLDKLDIMTLIDFRTTYETKNLNFGRRKYEDNFMSFSVKKESQCSDIDHIDRKKEALIMEDFTCYSTVRKIYKGTPRVGERRNSSIGIMRKRYNLPLINDPYFMNGVYPNAPASVKLKCAAARFLPQSDKISAYFLLKHLNDLGLFEMYRLTIEHTSREIMTVFSILKCPDNYPVSLFCSLGKDRTGIMTALILSCLGVPRDIILDDYHETEIHLLPSMDSISRYFNRIGLTNREFILAPREVMQRLLEYIDSKYGSVSQYLNGIGFCYQAQKDMFEFVTEEVRETNGATSYHPMM